MTRTALQPIRPGHRDHLDRRAFLGAVGVLAVPRRAASQPTAKVYRVGLLAPGDPARAEDLQAFFEGLAELGWVEGRNIAVERRYWRDHPERQRALAGELVALKVDVLVTATGRATLVAQGLTRTIPIVMLASGDAVRQGIVASLARPGSNVTGMTTTSTETSAKRLQFLKEAVPGAGRVGVLRCAPEPVDIQQWTETSSAAKALGVQLVSSALPPVESAGVRSRQLATALESVIRQKPDALLFFDCGTLPPRAQVVELARKAGLFAMYYSSSYVRVGGAMSYGADTSAGYRRAATYVDRILRGARPTDLPVEQPARFELVINLKTAKALGLTIPPSLLQRADQVLE